MRNIQAAIVVWFNPSFEVIENIDSYIDDVATVYCIDNSDGDNSHLYSHEKFKYFPQFRNVGLASALKIGCDLAIQDGATIITTFDQDTFCEANIAKKMADKLLKIKTVGLVAPNIKYIYRNEETGERILSEEIVASPHSEHWVITSGSTFRSSTYQELGGFDEKLFIGQIDQDFCFRLLQCRYQIIQLSDYFIYQELGNTIKKRFFGKLISIPHLSPIRYYYIFRNERYLRRKWKHAYLPYQVSLHKYLISIILFEEDKISKLTKCLKGYWDGKKI
ncbi:glycosyltransferase [Streptococcus suis]